MTTLNIDALQKNTSHIFGIQSMGGHLKDFQIWKNQVSYVIRISKLNQIYTLSFTQVYFL